MDPRVVELQKEAAARDDVIGLAGGLPADELLPRAELARVLADVTSREGALQYGWAEGTEQLRKWIAGRLAARGADVDCERVIVTAGAQQALAIAARVLSALPGKKPSASEADREPAASPDREPTATVDYAISVGDATYAAAIDAFTRSGARVVRTAGDARYVIHGVANPHGVDLVDRSDVLASSGPLIVDEAYSELRFDGNTPRPLLADAPDRVWHVGTISKTIAPGLRVGWLIPPEADHATALEFKAAADLQTSSVTQAAVARLVATVDYDAMLERARRAYAERAALLCEALHRAAPALSFREPEGGFSIWIETTRTGDDLALLRACLDGGVMVDPGSAFRAVPCDRIAVRASYSNAPPDRLAEAARRLARVLA